MEQITIAPIPSRLTIRIADNKVRLAVAVQDKIDEYWLGLVRKNPKLRNGEVFTVTSVEESADSMTVMLAETNYAHYLYSQQVGGLGSDTVRIIHPAALVITSDNRFIVGSMGSHTSLSGVIQCCGGGIDHSDIKDGVVDVEHSITKELAEELGIDANDSDRVKQLYPAYLKSGGPTGKMTVCYILKLHQPAKEFMDNYANFVKVLRHTGEEPEFEELFCIHNSQEDVEAFISEYGDRLNEYMAVLFRAAYKDLA